MPDYRPDFALIGAIFTFGMIGLMVWRVLQPTEKVTIVIQFIFAQGFVTIPLFLISYRFWLAYLDIPSLLIALFLLFIYIFAWSIPLIAPSLGVKYLREIRYPKSLPMRIISSTALALSGGSAVFSMYFVRYISDRFGSSKVDLLMAILTTAGLIFGIPYLAVGLWEERHGFPPTPIQKKE